MLYFNHRLMTFEGASSNVRARFGSFEADLTTGELFKNGVKLAVQKKPFQILSLLLLSAEHFVTREELSENLWSNVFVQTNLSLNTAIRRLRLALMDSKSASTLIETVGSRGYRLKVPVTFSGHEMADSHNLARRLRLAIVPFVDLKQGSDFFSDGLTAEMISQLGRMCKSVSVIAPISSMQFKATAKTSSQIAQQLRADFLLSGTVLRTDGLLQITVRLIRASDQSCAWTESYVREDAAIFTVQEEIAISTARAILPALADPVASIVRLKTSPAVYEKYLKGCFFANKFIEPAFEKAEQYFQQVLAEDPDFAPVHVALAIMYTAMGQWGGSSRQRIYERIKSEAATALAVCGEIADAHAAIGYARLYYDGNWDAAESSFQRALELNPSSERAHIGYAQLLTALGRHGEAIAAAQRAHELDPLSPIASTILSAVLYFAGNLDEALTCCLECIEMEPNFPTIHAELGVVYGTLGNMAQAVGEHRVAVRLCPESPLMLAHLAYSLALAGIEDEARSILEELLRARPSGYIPPYWLALIYKALGEEDVALSWFETAVMERCGWRLIAAVDPKVGALATHPRYRALLRQMQLSVFPEVAITEPELLAEQTGWTTL